MKELDKHIQKSNFVKVYLSDDDGHGLKHFEGVIFSYINDFVFMCDFSDFNPDGFVVFRKKDISEIRRTDNEKFFDKIIREENLLRNVRILKREAPFRLGTFENMFSQLKEIGIPVIIECLYEEEEVFQLGTVNQCDEDGLTLQYLSSFGVFDHEPMQVDYDDITFFRFGSPYANLFLKHASKDAVLAEMKVDIEPKKKLKKIKREEESEFEYDEPIVLKKVHANKMPIESVEFAKVKKSKEEIVSKKDKKAKKDKKWKKEKTSRKDNQKEIISLEPKDSKKDKAPKFQVDFNQKDDFKTNKRTDRRKKSKHEKIEISITLRFN